MDKLSPCSTILMGAGSAFLLSVLYRLFRFCTINYLTSFNMRKKYAKSGDWAVVTGASEGIGHAMALDLARRGFNVCVIARTQSKLDAVVQEIELAGVMGKSISFDFALATDESWKDLFKKLDDIRIAVLVNNVGVNYEYTNYFHELDVETDLRLLKVNTEATVRLTKYVLPNMKEHRAGAIICMGSVSAVFPTPLLATYAGTKAFNLSFAASLHYELKEFGIDVMGVSPNLVVSKMTQGKSSRPPKESFLMVNANAMARKTLNQLGSVPVTAGHSNHGIVEGVMGLLPTTTVANMVLKLNKSIKKRAERPRK
eukprot:gene9738-6826_t